MIRLPEHIIEQIKFFAEEQKLGFSELSTEFFSVLIIGNTKFSSNEVSIMASHLMLERVITSSVDIANEAALQRQEERKEILN